MTTPILNGAFARGLAGGEYIGLADGDRTLSAAQYRGPEGAGLKHHFFIAGGATGSGRSVRLPAVVHMAIWYGDPAYPYTTTLRAGDEAVDLEPGQLLTVITDGTADGIFAIVGGEAAGASDSWQTVAHADSPHLAVAGEHLDIDSTAGTVTVTLPAEPLKFDEIFFSNLVGTFSTHALTVARNPDRDPDYTIDGDAADFLAEDDGDEFSLVYDGTSNWVVRV
jgi:hypothetical protein